LFYERGKISTRVAYNIRSRFVAGYVTVTDTQALAGDYTDPVSRLDFSFGYSPVKDITLSFDVSNLLAQPFTNYNASRGPTFRRDVRDESRFIALGARFRF
jgi:outer membrane receptor protein involved in Fe transport